MVALVASVGFTQSAEFEKAHAESGLPGFCVASADAAGVRFSQGYGWADASARRPYTADTTQPVGSVSKTLVGYALAAAAADGLISLDDPIDSALPYAVRNPRHPGKALTWWHLATHTSSIRDEPFAYARAYVKGADSQPMPAFVKDYFHPASKWALRARYLRTPPGGAFEYTNMGAALAATALEKVLGRSLDRHMESGLFPRLGMASTRWHRDPALATSEAILYEGDDAAGSSQPLVPYTLATWADGGLRTTCNDLARWLAAVLRAHGGDAAQLNVAAVRAMLTPQFASRPTFSKLAAKAPDQGLFWQFRRSGEVGHTGSDPGLSALIALDLSRGRGQVFITNADLDQRPKARDVVAQIWRTLRDTPE